MDQNLWFDKLTMSYPDQLGLNIMSELRDLYQQVILDHSKNPHNRGVLASANRKAEGYNPLCGDKVIIYLIMDGDTVKDVRFEGSGCAISTASVSILTDIIKGKTKADVQTLFEKFHHLVTDGNVPDDGPDLDKLEIFDGVKEFPMRVKCATLAWHTVKAAFDNVCEPVTTE